MVKRKKQGAEGQTQMYARQRNSHSDVVGKTGPSALCWCGEVMFDRRIDQLGNACVKFMPAQLDTGAGQPVALIRARMAPKLLSCRRPGLEKLRCMLPELIMQKSLASAPGTQT